MELLQRVFTIRGRGDITIAGRKGRGVLRGKNRKGDVLYRGENGGECTRDGRKGKMGLRLTKGGNGKHRTARADR